MILYNMGSSFAARACFNSAYVSMLEDSLAT